jgi:hypothetical protein
MVLRKVGRPGVFNNERITMTTNDDDGVEQKPPTMNELARARLKYRRDASQQAAARFFGWTPEGDDPEAA